MNKRSVFKDTLQNCAPKNQKKINPSSSIGIDQKKRVPLGQVGYCRLTFEPLPAGTTTFDIKAGEGKKDFLILGIKTE